MKNARSASPRENSSSVMEEEEEMGGSESGEGEGGSEDGRVRMTVGVEDGGRREDNEEDMGEGEGEGESDGCVRGCQQAMFFSVGEVRRRLSHHVSVPRKTFHRDPEDPSGTHSISPSFCTPLHKLHSITISYTVASLHINLCLYHGLEQLCSLPQFFIYCQSMCVHFLQHRR